MTIEEAIKELKDTLERLNLYKYSSVKLVGVKMPYGEVEEKKDLNGLWLAIFKAIKALKTLQRLEAYIKVVEATKADVVNIAILKAALKEEEE